MRKRLILLFVTIFFGICWVTSCSQLEDKLSLEQKTKALINEKVIDSTSCTHATYNLQETLDELKKGEKEIKVLGFFTIALSIICNPVVNWSTSVALAPVCAPLQIFSSAAGLIVGGGAVVYEIKYGDSIKALENASNYLDLKESTIRIYTCDCQSFINELPEEEITELGITCESEKDQLMFSFAEHLVFLNKHAPDIINLWGNPSLSNINVGIEDTFSDIAKLIAENGIVYKTENCNAVPTSPGYDASKKCSEYLCHWVSLDFEDNSVGKNYDKQLKKEIGDQSPDSVNVEQKLKEIFGTHLKNYTAQSCEYGVDFDSKSDAIYVFVQDVGEMVVDFFSNGKWLSYDYKVTFNNQKTRFSQPMCVGKNCPCYSKSECDHGAFKCENDILYTCETPPEGCRCNSDEVCAKWQKIQECTKDGCYAFKSVHVCSNCQDANPDDPSCGKCWSWKTGCCGTIKWAAPAKLAECDGDKSNICESDLESRETCGDCQTKCKSNEICENGKCTPCPEGSFGGEDNYCKCDGAFGGSLTSCDNLTVNETCPWNSICFFGAYCVDLDYLKNMFPNGVGFGNIEKCSFSDCKDNNIDTKEAGKQMLKFFCFAKKGEILNICYNGIQIYCKK